MKLSESEIKILELCPNITVIRNTNSTLGCYIKAKEYSYETCKFVSHIIAEYLENQGD